MARSNIKYELKKALTDKASYGRSKHEDKIATIQERAELRRQGATYEERLQVNHLRDHIYSYNTMKTYQQQVGYFGDYLIEHGQKRISLEDSRDYIQDYIDHLEEQGKSPWSINTALSAICKATGASIHDYRHPRRSISEITRGNAPRRNDASNARIAERLLSANRLLGLRRAELKNLRAGDIFERDNKVIVRTTGKGGRQNEQVFTREDEKAAVLALKEGMRENDKIFRASEFRNDADLHHERQQRAVTVYERVVEDMHRHPERREYYKQEVLRGFHDRGKTCKEDLDRPFCVRGGKQEASGSSRKTAGV